MTRSLLRSEFWVQKSPSKGNCSSDALCSVPAHACMMSRPAYHRNRGLNSSKHALPIIIAIIITMTIIIVIIKAPV